MWNYFSGAAEIRVGLGGEGGEGKVFLEAP
jgi:hypothetical protein